MTERGPWTLGLMLGGRSGRMQRNKALMPFGGTTMVEAVCAACRPSNGDVHLAVGRPDRPIPAAFGCFPQIYDRRPGRGPLAAIEVLLETCISPWLVIVPCDMVFLTSADLDRLVAHAIDSEADLCCFEGDEKPATFPLALKVATFRGRCSPIFLEQGGRVLGLADLGRLELAPNSLLGDPASAARKLTNLNRPEDLEGLSETDQGPS